MLARSQPRDGYAVRVLAVHTTEGSSYTAAGLRDAGWWAGSSHAIADDRTLLTPAEGCVPYDRASWTLRSGNRWSENIELVAMAGWTRAQWLNRPGLLDNCARWLAARSTARGIPLVKLTPQQYRAGQWGVIGHHDHTVGYSDGTHWDPGPGFPWDAVLDRARAHQTGGFLMALSDADQDELLMAARQIRDYLGANGGWKSKTVNTLGFKVNQLHAALPALLAGANDDSPVDVEALAAELAPLVTASVRVLSDADVQALASAAADEQDRRARERLGS